MSGRAEPSLDPTVFVPDPETAAASQLAAFIRHCEGVTGTTFSDPTAFHQFSVDSYRTFWRLFLAWVGLEVEGDVEPVCTGDEIETAEFFPNLRLSYVENLLRVVPGSEDEPAIVAHHARRPPVRLTRAELRAQVLAVAARLRDRGIAPGDRVVAVSGNSEQLVVVSLAAMALGATLSATAPDLGVPAVLARFQQLEPALLLYGVHGAPSSSSEDQHAKLDELVAGLPSLRGLVVLDDLPLDDSAVPVWRFEELRNETGAPLLEWPRFPFSHPLWVLFSTGTTGAPKCIVHTAGGALLEHLKEHVLHGDLRDDDVLFFQTSPAWMMWNWQLSALATGATVVLLDAPVTTPGTLWSVVEDEHVTVFGTGPAYLEFCASSGYRPAATHDLSALRQMLSTGSVLYDHQFDWVREQVGELPLQSISGGTDIVGCFLLGNPLLPVRRGRLQSRSLGLDVRAHDPDPMTGVGELTCHNPFPSRPAGLLGDHDGSAFHEAYFAANPGVWTHGDLVRLDEDGSARIHGRSDGVMNINGVRIAPAELYTLLADIPEITGSLAVEQRTPGGHEQSRLVLLVVLEQGRVLDPDLELRIRQRVGRGASPTHVPSLIVQVADLPRTHSGKDSERAARDALADVAEVVNQGALRNPESLQELREAVAAADRHQRETRLEQAGHLLVPGADLTGDLCSIFSLVLGVPCGPDDSFFDLGGTSIMIAELTQAIEDHRAHLVALSAVFSAPTPRALAAFIESDASPVEHSVVTLREGEPGARPVFVMYDATGDVLYYLALVDQLPGDRPVYGIRARGLDERVDEIDATVEDMAESAIDSMRLVQAGGTYTLVGSSFGGVLAYEVAARLLSAGMSVDVLVLVDPYLGMGALDPWQRRRFIWLGRPRQWARWVLTANPRRLRELLVRGWKRLRTGVDDPRPEQATARQREVMAACYDAVEQYHPPPVACDVVFVRAEIRFANKPDPIPLLRDRVEPGRFRLLHVGGAHGDTLVTPRLESLMPELAELLE